MGMTAPATTPQTSLPGPRQRVLPAAPPGPVWVITPTYNEASNLESLVRAIRAELPGATVLVVDDGSPDGTGALADRLAAADPSVEVLHRPDKSGLGSAYVAGFGRALTAGAGLLCEIDADFSHDPRDLRRLVAAARDGADLVIGSRYVADGETAAGWSVLRRALSRGAGRYARALLGLTVSDPTSGLRCYRASALRELDLESVEARGFAFQVELTHRAQRAGLQVAEIPITFGERHGGQSKMSAAIGLEALWRIPAWRRRA
jgi:dolichol-phosphate mannosyltransferase